MLETNTRLCYCFAAQIELLSKVINGYDGEIEKKVCQHVDYAIVKDLPAGTASANAMSLRNSRKREKTSNSSGGRIDL